MAFSIKNDEADLLVRQLVAVTGESLTEAVTISLRERLERTRRQAGGSRVDRINQHIGALSRLAVIDERTSDEILGYDDLGLPT